MFICKKNNCIVTIVPQDVKNCAGICGIKMSNDDAIGWILDHRDELEMYLEDCAETFMTDILNEERQKQKFENDKALLNIQIEHYDDVTTDNLKINQYDDDNTGGTKIYDEVFGNDSDVDESGNDIINDKNSQVTEDGHIVTDCIKEDLEQNHIDSFEGNTSDLHNDYFYSENKPTENESGVKNNETIEADNVSAVVSESTDNNSDNVNTENTNNTLSDLTDEDLKDWRDQINHELTVLARKEIGSKKCATQRNKVEALHQEMISNGYEFVYEQAVKDMADQLVGKI